MDVCQNNNPSTSGLDQQQLQLVPMNLAMDNGNIINTAATTALRMAKRQRDPVDEEHILTVSFPFRCHPFWTDFRKKNVTVRFFFFFLFFDIRKQEMFHYVFFLKCPSGSFIALCV